MTKKIGAWWTKRGFVAKLTLAIALFAIIVPFAIHTCYSVGERFTLFTTIWGATDVLLFYGTILGGGATLTAVYLTISHNNKQREMERKEEAAQRRLAFVSGLYFDALKNLDVTKLSNYAIHGEKLLYSTQLLFGTFVSANEVINIDINLSKDEKVILCNAVEGIKAYAQKTTVLLWELNKISSEYEKWRENTSVLAQTENPATKFKSTLDKLRDLYNSGYVPISDVIRMDMGKFEKYLLNGTDDATHGMEF